MVLMQSADLKKLRLRLGLDRLQFARLIGYTGTDRNDETRVRKYETTVRPPLHIARFVDLIERWYLMFGKMPDFPDWEYDYSHEPDPQHQKDVIDG
jgi:hypothetical protein